MFTQGKKVDLRQQQKERAKKFVLTEGLVLTKRSVHTKGSVLTEGSVHKKGLVLAEDL